MTRVDEIIERLNQYKATEAEGLACAQAIRSAAQEDLFVALCVKQVADMREAYHRQRLELLKSTETLGELEEIDLFANWLARSGGRPDIGSDWMLTNNKDHFQLPYNTYEAREVIYEQWRSKLPGIVTRLQKHPVLATLPEIELSMSGGGRSFEFSIQFVVT